MEDYEMKQILEKWKNMLDFVSENEGITGVETDRLKCAMELEHMDRITRKNHGYELTKAYIEDTAKYYREILTKYGKQ